MNLDEFSTVVDDRRYIKPQVALDESNAFIDALRNTQGQRTAEIAQDTYNLGTAVPSNLGGLGGSGSYFTSRYQTPQTNEVVANLRATAQAQALNDAMNNALAQAKQRYSNAYKAAQRRVASSTGPTNTPQDTDGDGDVALVSSDGANLDPNGLDSVTKKRGGGQHNSSIDSLNSYAGMTGGGQLPNSNTRTFYLRSPSGKRSWIVVRNGLNGPSIDTKMVSVGGSDNIKKFIRSKLKSGYRVVDGNDNDISWNYNLVWGL